MGTVRAFMFHDVRDENKYPKRYSLKSFLNKEKFKFQINEITKKYKIIDSKDLQGLDLESNENYAILTFDDGLKDHYWVHKYLKSCNLPATFLIPKMPIIEKKVMNTHKIQFIMAKADEILIKNDILNLFNNNDRQSIWDEYSKTSWKKNWWSKEMIFITNFLRKYKGKDFDCYEISNLLFNKYLDVSEEELSEDFYLDLNQIDEMVNNNMCIGGHGNISENLLLIDDVENDILESKKFVSSYSNQFVFSYPNGGFNDKIKEIMQKLNCKLSFTTVQKTLTDLDSIDYLEFPRYDSPQIIKLP